MKVLVNITTYAGLSAGAVHFYAKVHEMDSDESIYTIAKNRIIGRWEDFYRILEDEKEANTLTIKDNNRKWPYKVGDETWRFNSPEQIREWVEKAYPEADIAFLRNKELISEDLDVIERNPSNIIKTGKKIKIGCFEGFSPEFVKLVEDSVHEEIETPERYLDRDEQFHQDGVWVWGVTEPVRVLNREFSYI